MIKGFNSIKNNDVGGLILAIRGKEVTGLNGFFNRIHLFFSGENNTKTLLKDLRNSSFQQNEINGIQAKIGTVFDTNRSHYIAAMGVLSSRQFSN